MQKIFEDLSKHKLKVNCNLYDNLEIWYNRSSRYVLKYNTTLVENEATALAPEAVRQEVFRILASRARKRRQSHTSYEGRIYTQLQAEDRDRVWQEEMRIAHCIKDHHLVNIC